MNATDQGEFIIGPESPRSARNTPGWGTRTAIWSIALVLLASFSPAQNPPPAKAGVETCDPVARVSLSNGAYHLQNNEWNSRARACITPLGGTGFVVSASELNLPISGAPASFPSIYVGCHWGICTAVNPFPIQVAVLKSEVANWSVTHAAGVWDQGFDLWFSTKREVTGHPDGAELGITLRRAPGQGNPGKKVASVKIHGAKYDVWIAGPPETQTNFISYVSRKPQSSVKNFDLAPFIRDATLRGYIDAWWYQVTAEAGFEIWSGGAGLKTNAFSLAVK